MRRLRFWHLWTVVFGLSITPMGSAFAQPLPDDVPDRVVVPVPRQIAFPLNEAQSHIAAGQFHQAVQLLQLVIDNPEDYFLDDTCRSSTKRQALDMLRALPASGRQAYELEWGSAASALLDDARTSGNAATIHEVVRRFGLTRAAAAALHQLAVRAFDSGEFLTAALLWEQLQASQPGALSSGDQVQWAIAWDLARNAERGQQRLSKVTGPAVKLKGQDVPLPTAPQSPQAWFTAQVGPRSIGAANALPDWTEVRGGGTRHESAQATGPVGGPVWRVPVLAGIARDAETPQVQEYNQVRQLIDELMAQMTAEDKLTIPTAAPIVAGDTVVFRSLEGLNAVDRQTGQLRWRAVLSDAQLMRQRQALQSLQQQNGVEQLAVSTAKFMVLLREQMFRDATRGSLSTDGHWVFAVESSDPAATVLTEPQRIMLRNNPNPPSPVNKLVAYDLVGGRLVAEIGGHREEPALPFGGMFFLGPPLVRDGKLFCLAEANREVLLLQLRFEGDARPPQFVLEWSQPLAAPERLLAEATLRRLAGLVPSAAGPLLICPTAAGLVAAVDPLQQQLRWGYQYDSLEAMRTSPPRQILFRIRPGLQEIDEDGGRWLESAPVIAGSCVLLTPRDSAELHCVDFLDGTLKWKRPRGQGLFLAGVASDRVVVIGRNAVEALNLVDGKPAWATPMVIPPPAGRGLLLDGRYVLPLSTGEMATLDLNTGQILARSRLLEGQTAGNLAASHGALVSQSVYDLLGFASEPELEAQIASRLEANPSDPRALGWRGELRLHRGELEAGLTDLRTAQKLQPDARSSSALAAALLQGLRTDFQKYRAAAEELDRLPLDRQQRHEFVRLYAEGLTREGRRLEALQQYLRLAESAGDDPLWERIDEVLTARSDRVMQGRVLSLQQSASPQERQAMDAEIVRRLKRTDAPMIDVDRQFLRYFGQHPAAAEVRRRVIEHDLMHDPVKAQRALLALVDSNDAAQAGYATAQLAQMLREQPMSSGLRVWLQRLSREFSSVPVLNDKTGAQLLADWEIDVDALSATAADNWPVGDVDVEHKKKLATMRRIRLAETVGPLGPRFAGWSFEVLDDVEQTFTARDGAGRVKWRVVIPMQPEDQQVRYASQVATPRVFAAGAWLALSTGTKFAVWELPVAGGGEPRFSWQQSLTPPGLAGVASLTLRPEILPNGRRRLRATDVAGLDSPGQLIGLTPNNAVYIIGERLYAADPATGVLQWVRQGAPRQFEATLDQDSIVLLETTSRQARVYRTIDGVELARQDVGNSDDWLWFRGHRLLALTRIDDRQHLALHDLLRGETLWEQDVDVLARCRPIDDAEVLVLHPAGPLQCLALDTGRLRFEARLPALDAIEYLWARKVDDRYELVIRQPVPATGRRRVVAFDMVNQIEMNGLAVAVDGRTEEVLWTREIGPTAFDPVQPARSPILPFAARVDPPPHLAGKNLPPIPGLSATILDARTGAELYNEWESASPPQFQIELNGDRRQITANFHSWMIEFQFPEESVKNGSEERK